VRLVVSARSREDLYYADELPGPETTIVYTRATPPGFARPAGRLTTADVAPALLPDATAYVCGSPGFCDAASELLLAVGVPAERVRVERFGPTS
jgi:ferredoxin-NADP reductase